VQSKTRSPQRRAIWRAKRGIGLSSDLKQELQKALGTSVATASQPATAVVTVAHLYSRFCMELSNTTVKDPLGRTIHFRLDQFPYLIKLEHQDKANGEWKAAKARVVLSALEDGTFDANSHRFDMSRAKDLFRIPEIFRCPSAIHQNIHARVKGDGVYVIRPRGKKGPIKVALVVANREGEIVPVTSFWSTEGWLRTCAKQPPLWEKK
jgi:hypothetical protein